MLAFNKCPSARQIKPFSIGACARANERAQGLIDSNLSIDTPNTPFGLGRVTEAPD